MVLSTSQQVALAFTAVLFTFVVLPRIFGVGGTGAKETRFDPRYSKHGRVALVAEGRGYAAVPYVTSVCASSGPVITWSNKCTSRQKTQFTAEGARLLYRTQTRCLKSIS
ncbi:hypothetical protein EYF80_064703 [Liparis tanakae]|uniref:Uncharacterized protein n=1 Tax=Liparis tanakae TaxID=230148 RepID=A0A4Z2E8P1_9TELE|nr:hypothetical protein EYF80_064703 [Liparis tanakae]